MSRWSRREVDATGAADSTGAADVADVVIVSDAVVAAIASVSPPRRFTGALGRSRGQAEPIAALVAVLAVGAGLALYAGAAADATPVPSRSGAEPAMERLASTAISDGTVDPDAIPAPETVAAGGQRARITIAYDERVRRYGPESPRDADRATRPVAVRVRPGVRTPGRLVVEVWS